MKVKRGVIASVCVSATFAGCGTSSPEAAATGVVSASGAASAIDTGGCAPDAIHGSLGGTNFCISVSGGREVFREKSGASISYEYGPLRDGVLKAPVVVIQAAVMEFDRAVQVLTSDEGIIRSGRRPDGGAYAIAGKGRIFSVQHVVKARDGSLICRVVVSAAPGENAAVDAADKVCSSFRVE